MSFSEKKYMSVFDAVIDLEERIEKEFGDSFCEKINLQSLCSIQGTLYGKPFWFSPHVNDKGYVDGMCASSEHQEDKDILDDLSPVLTEFMGAEPICRYDLSTTFTSYEELDDKIDGEVREINEIRMCPTMEWNVMDPENRIRYLIGVRGTDIENLELLNGKSISDYEGKEEGCSLAKKPGKKQPNN